MKNKLYTLFCILFLAFYAGSQVKAQTTNYKSYAVLVHSIAKYSSWPSVEGEFKIVVLGNSKIYDELAVGSAGRAMGKATIKIEREDDVHKIIDAHIIYVSDSKSSELNDLLKAINGKPVMVIAEREGLFKKGASVSFVVVENSKLRFDINQTELLKRNVKISSHITTLAHEIL